MNNVSIDDIDIIVFDFDGVLTNNYVYLNSNGEEFVSCSRSDGLAFDVLKKLNKPYYIVSTEKNLVVSARAKKINASVVQGIDNKVNAVKKIVKKENSSLKRIFYIGNDLNDYLVMNMCGYTACPSDSHKKIKSISDIVLNTKGGLGVARELLEDIFNLDIVKILY